ncbi:MAG: hypothetical protein VX874_14065 [Pseudomonadota bacterium]|nr:hypothetical protein [Pseudomonadota bacterium]
MTRIGWKSLWTIRVLARIAMTAPNPADQPLLRQCGLHEADASGWQVRLAKPPKLCPAS